MSRIIGAVGVTGDPEDGTRAAVAAAIEAAIARGEPVTRLAEVIGMSRQMIGNYRAQTHAISLPKAVQLAAYLDLTVDQLSGAAPLPSRSPILADLAQQMADVAVVQEGLVSELRDAASRLAHLGGHDGGDLTGTG